MNDKIVIEAETDELTIEPINGKVIDLENSDLSVGKIVFKKKEKELPTIKPKESQRTLVVGECQ